MSKLPAIVLGTWSWGTGAVGGDQIFGNNLSSENLKPVFDAAMKSGLTAWAIAKGTTPIIGVTKQSQVEDAVKASEIKLSEEEINLIEYTAENAGVYTKGSWENPMD